MSDRLTAYLERCLSEVPDSEYRLRLQKELEEHFADLAEGFIARGYEESEAFLRALEKLGNPEKLREEYREAWRRQPERWRKAMGRLAFGCFLALLGHMLALIFLEHFGSAAFESINARRVLPLAGDPRWRLFSEAVLFAGRTLPCLLWLLLCFRRSPERRAWVTTGLLLTWVLDKALLLLQDGSFRETPVSYLLGTLAGVLLLGLVFS
jgi:Predicted membrane protein